MKTVATKKRNVRKTNTPKSFVSRCEKEINDSVVELTEHFPKLGKAILNLLISLAVVLCDSIRIILYFLLKSLITVPNAIEGFLGKAFAHNKNGKIVSIAVRLAIIISLFALFLSIISSITFPIGKLALLNIEIRSSYSNEIIADLLQQKDEIYSAGGFTGWLSCQSAFVKIISWIISVYLLTMTGISISKLSFSLLTLRKVSLRKVSRIRKKYLIV